MDKWLNKQDQLLKDSIYQKQVTGWCFNIQTFLAEIYLLLAYLCTQKRRALCISKHA